MEPSKYIDYGRLFSKSGVKHHVKDSLFSKQIFDYMKTSVRLS